MKERKEISNPEDYPAGSPVTVQVSGTITPYLDHWGVREIEGSFKAWNGQEVFFTIKVPADAIVVG